MVRRIWPRIWNRSDNADRLNIEFAGMDLNDEEKRKVTNIIAGYSRKLHTDIFHLNIKSHDNEGKRKRFVVSLNATTDFGRFSAEDSSWFLSKALKNSIRKIEKQVSHAMGKRA